MNEKPLLHADPAWIDLPARGEDLHNGIDRQRTGVAVHRCATEDGRDSFFIQPVLSSPFIGGGLAVISVLFRG